MERRTLVEKVHVATLVAIVLAVVLKTAISKECHHDVYKYQVKSPNFPDNYPSNYECSSKFETTPGCTVKILFTAFDLESSQNCSYDYVAFYDGDTSNDPLLLRHCGNQVPENVISTENKMLMVFRTDTSVTRGGFRAKYWTECFRFLPPHTEEVVTSPDYQGTYPYFYYRAWNFETSPGYIIKLVFDALELLTDFSCLNDYVTIHDGDFWYDIELKRFCNHEIPIVITSTEQKMFLLFSSDGSLWYRDFRATLTTEFNFKAVITDESKRKLTQYFLNTRQHRLTVNKWGKDITRTAVALFLDDPQFFSAGNGTGEEIAYELTMQLMSKLVLKKRISTKDLALFVNAITVACIDPTNFFGVNIVSELRNRVDNSNDTNPFFILTLCNGGDNMKMEDVRKLQQLFHAHSLPSWTDTQAMVVMALKCISRQLQGVSNSTLSEMASELKRKQQTNGIVENLKTTAIVIQALIATNTIGTTFNLSTAIKSIVKDMKHTQADIEEMYYFLPILKWKTLLDVNSNHCASTIKTDLREMMKSREHPDERIQVQISIIIGDLMDFSRTWRIKVPSGYSLYQLLENISSSEPGYKVRYAVLDGKPYVAGLDNFRHSIEDGSFWFIFTKPLSSTDDPVLLKESPADIQVNETDELILWYRSIPSDQKIPSNITDVPSVIPKTNQTSI